jgi:uncharacterized membrane protein YphA (DoxX/SURF4 family)
MAKTYLGRYVYGLAAVAFGIVTLAWHDFNNWQQIRALGNVPHREIPVYLAAATEIFGGLAIQWTKTARAGAITLGPLYFIFALLWVPHIVAEPRVYDRWGNFFEQFSLVSGALMVYGAFSGDDSHQQRRWLASRTSVSESALCLHARTTFLSFWNRILRPKMDSSGTNVLGNSDHDCACARGHRLTFRTFRPSSRALTYSDAHRLRAAGVAARIFRRST